MFKQVHGLLRVFRGWPKIRASDRLVGDCIGIEMYYLCDFSIWAFIPLSNCSVLFPFENRPCRLVKVELVIQKLAPTPLGSTVPGCRITPGKPARSLKAAAPGEPAELSWGQISFFLTRQATAQRNHSCRDHRISRTAVTIRLSLHTVSGYH